MEPMTFFEFLEALGKSVIRAPFKAAAWYTGPKTFGEWVIAWTLTIFMLTCLVGLLLDIIYALR